MDDINSAAHYCRNLCLAAFAASRFGLSFLFRQPSEFCQPFLFFDYLNSSESFFVARAPVRLGNVKTTAAGVN
jgi:hypothetical protein